MKKKNVREKSRQIIDREKRRWNESQTDAYKFMYGTSDSAKSWFVRMFVYIIISFVLSILVLNLNTFLGEMLLILPICVLVFVSHELIHIATAKVLGYEIKWYPINIVRIPRTQRYITMQGFDITFPNKSSLKKHSKLIALMPYALVFPLAIIFVFSNSITLHISAVILIGTHLLSLRGEAKTK